MKETLTGRVGRIISGGLNALIDVVENAAPETVMEEAIREIDGAIDEVRAQSGLIVANKYLANTRLMEENKKYDELVEKIEVAIKENREDLAEVAVSQQLDIEAQIPILEATISDSLTQNKELEGYINALQAKKREMNDELKQFRHSRKKTESVRQLDGTATPGIEVKVEKAASTFDRVVEKASGVLGSSTPIERNAAIQLAELDDLARNNRIKERLAAIKHKVK